MKPSPFGNVHSHGDLHSLEIIEDRSGTRRRHGLPQRYSKGRFLGKGGFAKCYEVQDMESKEVFAAKIVSKVSVAKPRALAKLRSEIAIHRSLEHDKVVKFFDYFEDNDFVYIILELCPSQTLNEFMRKRPGKRLSEPEALFYVYDLVMALKYLHRHRVIHRDLKLGNLFLDADVRLKVGDFGLAAQLEHDSERKRTICGTPNYIAPEILEGKHGHSYEVDVWSLGVIIYTMIIGRPPFETSDVKTTYRKIRYNQYSFPEAVYVTEQSKELITSILKTEPKARPSLDEILVSQWFRSSCTPPPMPATISAYAVSPRFPVGGCSARSETPERGIADFARIDSPAPRFPLRDRSPSPAPPHPGPGQPMQRGHSATPLLPTSKPVAGQLPYVGGLPSGRKIPTPSSGRPPPVQWGNDENAAPPSANIGAGRPAPLSPRLDAFAASCVAATAPSPAPEVQAASPPLSATHPGPLGPCSARDASPLMRLGGPGGRLVGTVSSLPMQSGPQPCGQLSPLSSGLPMLAGKPPQQQQQQQQYAAAVTPGRYIASGAPPCGRPPMAQWGGDEGTATAGGNAGTGRDASTPRPPQPHQQQQQPQQQATEPPPPSAPGQSPGQCLASHGQALDGQGQFAPVLSASHRGPTGGPRDASPIMRLGGPSTMASPRLGALGTLSSLPPQPGPAHAGHQSARAPQSAGQPPCMGTLTPGRCPTPPATHSSRPPLAQWGGEEGRDSLGSAPALASPHMEAFRIGRSPAPAPITPVLSATHRGTVGTRPSPHPAGPSAPSSARLSGLGSARHIDGTLGSARADVRCASAGPATAAAAPAGAPLVGIGGATGADGAGPVPGPGPATARSASCGPACSSRHSPRARSASGSASAASGEANEEGLPNLWVAKWVDYSSKYGVGYILSDGSVGVYFNDSTKIILVADGSTFDYVTRRTQDKPEVRSTHTFESYPDDLKKKVTLLRHFKNYMLTDVLERKDGATMGESSLPISQAASRPSFEPGQAPYVKKWTRNKHAIMFQLSNRIVQVIFFDRTEAVLSSKSHVVAYVDKQGQVASYPLSNVLDVPSAELAKRLRYTKDILVNMLGSRPHEHDLAPAVAAH